MTPHPPAPDVVDALRRVPLFSIGAAPRTAWLDGVVQRDEYQFVRTGPDLRREPPVDPGAHSGGRTPWRIPGWPLDREPYRLDTSVPGVLCAGDGRHRRVQRVASAVGEGAIAVQCAPRYLAGS